MNFEKYVQNSKLKLMMEFEQKLLANTDFPKKKKMS